MNDFSMFITALFLVSVYFLYVCSKSDSEKSEIIKDINKKKSEETDYTAPYVDEDGTATVYVNGEPTKMKIAVWSDEMIIKLNKVKRLPLLLCMLAFVGCGRKGVLYHNWGNGIHTSTLYVGGKQVYEVNDTVSYPVWRDSLSYVRAHELTRIAVDSFGMTRAKGYNRKAYKLKN